MKNTGKRRRKSSSKSVIITISAILVIAVFAGAWYFWWSTQTVFDYSLQPVVALDGQVVFANSFLADTSYMQNVTATFRTQNTASVNFRSEAGRHELPVTLRLGRRSVDTVVVLYALSPIANIHHEFATEAEPLQAINMLENAQIASGIPFSADFAETPLPLSEYEVGEHTLNLTLNGFPFQILLIVEDTTSPTATPVDASGPMSHAVYPEDFVANIYDASQIASVSFLNEPDVFVSGYQNVEVAIEDIFGNQSIIVSTLYVERNEIPPTFEGIAPRIISMIGETIMYRAGVSAFDAFGRELDFEVDSSEVDQHTVGLYTVLYRAEDGCGNLTEVSVVVEIVSIDVEYVRERVDDILATILTDGMTQVQQARAIFNWIRFNMNYAAVRGGPESAYEGAFIALNERRGNCFIYYSIGEIMLTRAGIPNMRVQRISIPGVATTHLWSLINPDNLGWHHFDSNPIRGNLAFRPQMYMFTQSQATDFARQLREVGSSIEYFTFDQSLFPEVVE